MLDQTILLLMVIIGLVCLIFGMVIGAQLTRPRYPHPRDERY